MVGGGTGGGGTLLGVTTEGDLALGTGATALLPSKAKMRSRTPIGRSTGLACSASRSAAMTGGRKIGIGAGGGRGRTATCSLPGSIRRSSYAGLGNVALGTIRCTVAVPPVPRT